MSALKRGATTSQRRTVSTASIPSNALPLVTTNIITVPTVTVSTTSNANDDVHRIAILRMNHKPVNALSMELCKELSDSIRRVQKPSSSSSSSSGSSPVSAIIVSSSIPNIFSAGIDIQKELYKPDRHRLSQFWFSFQQLFLDLYGSTRPRDDSSSSNNNNNNDNDDDDDDDDDNDDVCTIAAIDGHAPAGGCMIASSCDYRMMTDLPTLKIGLNESKLGIAPPPWMAEQYIQLVSGAKSYRQAEVSLLLGELFTPRDAVRVGLIDELVTVDANDVYNGNDGDSGTTTVFALTGTEKAAVEKSKEFLRIPLTPRRQIKQWTRKRLTDLLLQDDKRQEDIDKFCDTITSNDAQYHIESYLHSLKTR